ncbi:hypothetical protein V6x_21590 [Gimesia chilikensis]|uniref:Uncharacterized protein n=1 Tax=Gimesia chilikensis TaxID=2605989 RepID=A0A517WB23_9PLAN|nr:hypothetical protein [Gimesia chilikensis]QDU02454.1 hypothetical protein V6x_21590 [Gimesia chilikensis]
MNLSSATEKQYITNISRLSLFTGGYCLFFGIVLFAVSLVMHPTILIGAVLHLITGLLYFLLAKGIQQRSERSISALTFFSVALTAVSFTAILYMVLDDWNIPALIGLTIFLIINLQLFIELILWKRLRRRLSSRQDSQSQESIIN